MKKTAVANQRHCGLVIHVCARHLKQRMLTGLHVT